MERGINERFDRVERSSNERFDRVERNIDDLKRENNNSLIQRVSSSGRFKNQLKGAGGRLGTSSAYFPIANDENKYPSEQGLELLTSIEQLNPMNSTRINEYLRFYGLSTVGNLEERKYNLLRYIGVG